MKKTLLPILLWPAIAMAGDFFGIVEYKPSNFTEQAAAPFYYSIGKELRFGESINESSPILFEGKFSDKRLEVFPSPDQKKAAVVSGGDLYLVEVGKPALLLLRKVGNLEPRNVRVGEEFYKYTMLQWDAHSQYIYIARDKRKKRVFEQSFSTDATLVHIDVSNPTCIDEVIQDFRSLKYFFVGDDFICFDYALGNGDVIWKCSLKGNIQPMKEGGVEGVVLQDGTRIDGRIFLSYGGGMYERDIWLSRYGFSLSESPKGYIGFYSRHKQQVPIFRIRGGLNIKGGFVHGVTQYGCSVLAGGRYALLNVWHDNFKGQLLIDGVSGQYRELPRNTRVHQNLNSSNYENVIFSMTGTTWPEFLPIGKHRFGSFDQIE